MNPFPRTAAILLLTLGFCSLSSADSGKKVKLKGHIVDVSCSIEQKDDLNYMRSSHSKGCFQMPACEKSGYAILTADDQVIKFDAKGNDIAKQLIHSTNKDKDWRISVRGKMNGEVLAVSKIELEK
jgi:type 1 fimbria pilin